MKISIASGKGGTGKTTVSVNLSRMFDADVVLADCDVEEPNAHLFLKADISSEEIVSVLVPWVDEKLCDSCGDCAKICKFSAIVSFGNPPLIFPELCHSCGGCAKVCPTGAIVEQERRIGVVEKSHFNNITLITGRLDIGVVTAPPLIRAVKNRLPKNGVAILDAPPGTSCPVITAIQDSDIVLLVTEPTPFGLNDLALAVDMVREMKLPFGVIINRVGSGDNRVHDFCQKESIDIFMEIPDDRKIAEAYSRGALMVDALPQYGKIFKELASKLTDFQKKRRNL